MKGLLSEKKLALMLVCALLVGCGSDDDSDKSSNATQEESSNGGNDATGDSESQNTGSGESEGDSDNAEYSATSWNPKRIEWYNSDGTLAACQRNQLDADGYFQSAKHSHISLDENHPVECSDNDINRTYTEYTYSVDRSQFTTQTQSTYAPNVTCEKTVLSSLGVVVRSEVYVSSANNYSCSVQDGQLFSLQLTELEDNYYDTLITYYAGPGIDTLWETDDDIISGRFVSTWVDDRLTKTTLNYPLPGDDGVWETDDDLLSGSVETVYQADKAPDYSISRTPGLDGVPNTSDDLALQYTKYQYENGKIKSYTIYSSAGPDFDWEATEDNTKSMFVSY